MLPLALALLALFAPGCSGESAPAVAEPGPSGPPAAYLRAPDGAAAEGTLGSYCWTNLSERLCRDTLLVTAEAPIALAPGAGVAVSFADEPPASISVTWLRVETPPPPVVNGKRVWDTAAGADADGSGTRAPSRTGLYLLSVLGDWPAKGDASYAWYIEVK